MMTVSSTSAKFPALHMRKLKEGNHVIEGNVKTGGYKERQ
jgi:hypothetical protein